MNQDKKEEFIYPVGERIKFFREQKKMTVNKLANTAGISQSYLRDIELSNKNPTVELLALICQALSISLAEFFSDDVENQFKNDEVIQTIYRLTKEQRSALLTFLRTISNDFIKK